MSICCAHAVLLGVMLRTYGSGCGAPPIRIAICQTVPVASDLGCVKSMVRV
jgi:hypothetical protein